VLGSLSVGIGAERLATLFAVAFIAAALTFGVLLVVRLVRAMSAGADRAQQMRAERRRPTPYRFNPPPGWPTPAPDWAPAPGWEPERSWPPLPPGWQLWQRTAPRPAPPQRRSAWDPNPAADRMVDVHFQPEKIRQALTTADGQRSLQIAAMQLQMSGLESRLRFEGQHRPGGERAARRGRWHPLEWAYRHAADGIVTIAGELSDALAAVDDDGSTAALGEEHVARWQHLYGWIDEMLDAAAERAGVSRDDPRLRGMVAGDGARSVAVDTTSTAWQDAEHLAAAALRQFGFVDANVTGAGADRGLDGVGGGVAAQVKYTGATVGRPLIQQLVGAAGGRQTALFARSGFTQHAVEEADRHGMALFTLALPTTVRVPKACA
jgi:hypothetical protein